MKNFMLILMLALFVATSCNKEEQKLELDNASLSLTLPMPFKTTALTDITIKDKVKSLHAEHSNFMGGRSNISFDFENLSITDYEGTDVKVITAKGIKNDQNNARNYSYVTFYRNGQVLKESLVIKIEEQEQGEYISTYFDIKGNILGALEVNNGSIVRGYHPVSNSNLTRGWWSDWAGCVSDVFNHFTDGSFDGSASGLLCVAFSAECATVVAFGCIPVN